MAEPKITDGWSTPLHVFQLIERTLRIQFDLDVAASDTNHKCEDYFTRWHDGLRQSWSERTCWCNPPYSDPAPWILKARHESRYHGATVALLVRLDASTQIWHEHTRHAQLFYFTRRIQFVPPPELEHKGGSAPFSCVLAVFWAAYRYSFQRSLIRPCASVYSPVPGSIELPLPVRPPRRSKKN